MHHNIRLSRISHPRTTWLGITLVIGVFVAFGIWAQICAPELINSSFSAPDTVQSTVSTKQHRLAPFVTALR